MMANSEKQQRAEILDPKRFEMAKQMSPLPGSPDAMVNNPQNLPGPQPSSMSGVNLSPYGDMGRSNDPRLGGVWAQPNSGIQQANTAGRGYQGNIGRLEIDQIQPPPEASDPLEASRLDDTARKYGLNFGPMGPIGMEATAATGALPATLNVNENTLAFGAPFTGAKGTGMGRGSGRNQKA